MALTPLIVLMTLVTSMVKYECTELGPDQIFSQVVFVVLVAVVDNVVIVVEVADDSVVVVVVVVESEL